jgi:hypothetical protein
VVDHDPRPGKFGAAARSRSYGIRLAPGKVNQDDECALVDTNNLQDIIKVTDDALVLPTAPVATSANSSPYLRYPELSPPRSIASEAGCGTHGLDVTPQRTQDIVVQLAGDV